MGRGIVPAVNSSLIPCKVAGADFGIAPAELAAPCDVLGVGVVLGLVELRNSVNPGIAVAPDRLGVPCDVFGVDVAVELDGPAFFGNPPVALDGPRVPCDLFGGSVAVELDGSANFGKLLGGGMRSRLDHRFSFSTSMAGEIAAELSGFATPRDLQGSGMTFELVCRIPFPSPICGCPTKLFCGSSFTTVDFINPRPPCGGGIGAT